jgi:hypothetical protein
LLNCRNVYTKFNIEGLVIASDGIIHVFYDFNNIFKSRIEQHVGTYRLVINGWPLLILGAIVLNDDGTHSCIPLLLAWVKSEPELAYRRLFEAFPAVLLKYFGFQDLHVIACVSDHSDSIRYNIFIKFF